MDKKNQALEYHHMGYNCAQAAIIPFCEELGFDKEEVFKMAEAFGFGMALCFVLERIFCMGIHIALTVMVFYGVRNHQKKYLLKAVVCHMLLDVLPALYQRNVVGLIPTEVYLGACCVILCIFAHKLYKNL